MIQLNLQSLTSARVKMQVKTTQMGTIEEKAPHFLRLAHAMRNFLLLTSNRKSSRRDERLSCVIEEIAEATRIR
jgi:hypothetical protein